MRFVGTLFFFALGLGLGWIGGSLHPAPQAWLDRISIDALQERLGGSNGDAEGAAPDERTLARYRAWISEARAEHPYSDSEERMYAVMMCESGGQARAVNPAGPFSGLFQYADATWNGDWNSYRNQNVLNARAQIFATALAWSLGMQGQWGCYTRAQ